VLRPDPGPAQPFAVRRAAGRGHRLRRGRRADVVADLTAAQRVLRHCHVGARDRDHAVHREVPVHRRRHRHVAARAVRLRPDVAGRVHVLDRAGRHRPVAGHRVRHAPRPDRPGPHRDPRRRGGRAQFRGAGRPGPDAGLRGGRDRLRRGRGGARDQPAHRAAGRRVHRAVDGDHGVRGDHRRARHDRGPDHRRHRGHHPAADAAVLRRLVPDRARAGRDRRRPVRAARAVGADRRSPEHPAVPGRILAVDAGEHRPARSTQTRNPAAPGRAPQLGRLGRGSRGENGRVLLSEIAEVSRAVAGTSARLAKIELLAAALREAGPLEVPIAVAYLSGELPQRQIGVGWAALRDGFAPAPAPTLTLSEVDSGFSAIGAVSGKGSAAARKALVGELFGRATADEQRFLVGLLSAELRQGALEGVMTEAVARAADVPVAEVRRAMMLRGSLGVVAAAALSGGSEALGAFGLEVGRPVRPMLATSAPTLADALEKAGAQEGQGTEAALEWKLDGIRIQAHLSGGSVRLFTRTLDDITARLADVAAVLAKLPVRAAVLDGELIALREDGRPLPFQDTASRTASFEGRGPAVPLSVFLFDALHLEGADLIDLPYWKRHTELAGAVPADLLMPRLVTASAEEAAAFFTDALAHGHEGVVVKSLTAPYAAGRRGAGWIKVKPRHTLDLVVLAVEWGHGRRRGWLSNLHLGARDPDTGGFVMLGKTFKGLTDELLTWQTSRLLGLEERRDSYTVYVRPELVVEIAFDGVQRSPRYPGGLALRFARVLRYREDKTAADADTIDTIRALSPGYLAPDP